MVEPQTTTVYKEHCADHDRTQERLSTTEATQTAQKDTCTIVTCSLSTRVTENEHALVKKVDSGTFKWLMGGLAGAVIMFGIILGAAIIANSIAVARVTGKVDTMEAQMAKIETKIDQIPDPITRQDIKDVMQSVLQHELQVLHSKINK